MRKRRRSNSTRYKVGRPALRLSRLLSLAAAALGLVAVILLVNYLVQGKQLRSQQAELKQMYVEAARSNPPEASTQPAPPSEQPAPTIITAQQEQTVQVIEQVQEREAASDRFVPLMRRNNDVVGWLTYPAIPEMDFAVVQRDNTHYLNRSFTGQQNLAGTVFLDQANSVRPRDKNLILHGHNMKDGTMFGKLARLLEPTILRNEPLLRFDTLYQDALYVPYALTVFSINTSDHDYFNVLRTDFIDQGDMAGYVNWLVSRSSLGFPTDVRSEDRLLTLITCHGINDSERIALALRAVRPGEDIEQIKAAMATGVVRR